MKILITVGFCLFAYIYFSQNSLGTKKEKVLDVNMEGQIVVFSGASKTLFGFGGPGLKFKYNPRLVRFRFCPSLSFPHKKTEDQYQISFTLAFGLEYLHWNIKGLSLLLA